MSNLEKFYNLWTNLDKSYLEMKDILKVSNKTDFLKKICYSNDEKVLMIPKIKTILKNELSNYNDVEKLKYSELVEYLDSIEIYLSSNDLDSIEIKNLNAILTLALINKKESTIDKVLDSESLISQFRIRNNPYLMTLESMFKEYGETSNFAKIFKNNVVVGVIDKSIESPSSVIITSDNLNSVIERAESTEENSSFLYRVIKALKEIYEKRQPSSQELPFMSRQFLESNKLSGRSGKIAFSGETFIEYSYNDKRIYLV